VCYQGGFAKCYELTDQKTGVTYAGKIIAKSRIAKGNQKDKVEINLNPFVSFLVLTIL